MLTLFNSSWTKIPFRRQASLLQSGWKAKLKSCCTDYLKSDLPSRYLPLDSQSWFWICSSFKTSFGNKTMALQDKFVNVVLKKKNDTKSAVKRKSKKIGWLIAGCCFSKKSKNDSTFEDISEVCEAAENRLEASYAECSESQALLSEEKRLEKIVTLEPAPGFPVHERTSSDVISKGEKPSIKVKEPVTKEGKEIDVRRKDGKGKPSKPRPNYFVAIQVDNPEIHKSLQNVQESLVDNAPLMKRALISLSTLHITFVVMHVAQEGDLKRAEDALVASYDSIKEDLNESPLILTFEGLSNFKKQVLFAELKMDDSYGRILKIYEKIASCFESHGFDVREKDKFTPHLTVAKLSKDPRLRKKGLKQISPAWYEDFENDVFGEQLVKSLQFLKMEKASNGYYHCDKECFFDLPSSEPKVPLEKKLLFLSEKKKEVRKKIFDLTTEKLGQKGAS